VGLVVAVIALDRTSRRPDFAVGGLYLDAGLGAATRLGATVLGLTSLAVAGLLARIVIFLSVTGLTILRPNRSATGRGLWGAAIAVPIVALSTDWLVGAGFTIDDRTFSSHHRVLLILGVTALWVSSRLEVETVLWLARLVLGVYLVASLLTFLLGFPSATSPFGAILPGMGHRVSGIFDHPNALGPGAVLYLILERIQPSRHPIRIGMSVVAFALLIVAQSKTAWVVALAVYLVLAAGRWDARRALAGSVIIIGLAIPAAITVDLDARDIVDEIPIPHIDTLTGRTELWALGLETWREAPIVGQGSGIFLEIAERTGQRWQSQAHNEYIQALAENGLVGLAALVAYLVALTAVAWRHAARTRNGSLALLALLLLRTFTEVHLVALDLAHLTVIALFFAWERQRLQPPFAAAPGVTATKLPATGRRSSRQGS
jgi:O-antigen ligase